MESAGSHPEGVQGPSCLCLDWDFDPAKEEVGLAEGGRAGGGGGAGSEPDEEIQRQGALSEDAKQVCADRAYGALLPPVWRARQVREVDSVPWGQLPKLKQNFYTA